MAAEVRLASRREGTGPRVVLLHGLGLDGRMWDAFAARLREKRFTTECVDVRGHGASPTVDEEVTLDDLARDVAAHLERDRSDRPHLVGFSMGGMIAMRIAARGVPLASLTLVSTSGEAEPDDVRARYEPMAEAFRHMPASNDLADAFLSMQFRPGWAKEHPDVRDRYRRIVSEADRTGVWRASLAVIRRPTILDALRDVRAPTLVVAGSADTSTPPDHARRLAAAIPGARLAILDRAAHLLHEEEPDAFEHEAVAHLKAHTRWT